MELHYINSWQRRKLYLYDYYTQKNVEAIPAPVCVGATILPICRSAYGAVWRTKRKFGSFVFYLVVALSVADRGGSTDKYNDRTNQYLQSPLSCLRYRQR